MDVYFSSNAFEDFCYWQNTDKKIFNKLTRLIKNTQRTPFDGIGIPEPLRENLSGYWSRRITHEHRLVSNYNVHEVRQIFQQSIQTTLVSHVRNHNYH